MIFELVILRQDSKKLGKFLGKWNRETEKTINYKRSNNLTDAQPASELQNLISSLTKDT